MTDVAVTESRRSRQRQFHAAYWKAMGELGRIGRVMDRLDPFLGFHEADLVARMKKLAEALRKAYAELPDEKAMVGIAGRRLEELDVERKK